MSPVTFPNVTSLYMVAYGTALARAQALACGGSAITQYSSVQQNASNEAFRRFGDMHIARGLINDQERETLRAKWESSEAQCECKSIHYVLDDALGNYTVENFFLGIQSEYVNAVNGWHDKIDFTASKEDNVRVNSDGVETDDTTTCCSCYASDATDSMVNAADCSLFNVEDLSKSSFRPSVHNAAAMFGWCVSLNLISLILK